MNLQNIVVKVVHMELVEENNYDKFNPDDSTFAKDEVAKVTLRQEGAAPFKSLSILGTVPAGAPNPFVLGQRLAITIDADAVPAVHEQPPAQPRDEAVSPCEQFDRDVMGVGTETMPVAPVPEEVNF